MSHGYGIPPVFTVLSNGKSMGGRGGYMGTDERVDEQRFEEGVAGIDLDRS